MTYARTRELLNICLEQCPLLTTAELYPAFRERGYRHNRFEFDLLRQEVVHQRRANAARREERAQRGDLSIAA